MDDSIRECLLEISNRLDNIDGAGALASVSPPPPQYNPDNPHTRWLRHQLDEHEKLVVAKITAWLRPMSWAASNDLPTALFATWLIGQLELGAWRTEGGGGK